MKVNIVTVSSGWILQKIAERIQVPLSKKCDCTLSHTVDNSADVNYYIDIHNCYKGKTSTFDIGYFTHLDQDSLRSIQPHWLSLDHIVHMCSRYYNRFKDFYPEEKMSVILTGEISPIFSMKKPVLGIFQRGEFEGKGYNFMLSLLPSDIINNFKFKFVGKGWDEIVNAYNNAGVDAEQYTDENYEDYPSLYDRVDYLLIPSLWEGGPMSVVEAYAKGIPIISSNVGWVGGDVPVDYIFEPNSIIQLESILNDIMVPIKKRRAKVEYLNYEGYASKLYKLLCEKVK